MSDEPQPRKRWEIVIDLDEVEAENEAEALEIARQLVTSREWRDWIPDVSVRELEA